MNLDTIQNRLPGQAVIKDTTTFQIVDTLNIANDSIAFRSETKTMAGSFITEKDVVKNLPDQITFERVTEWITYLLLGAFILLTILNFLYQKNLIHYFKSIVGRNHANQLIRDGNPFKKRVTLVGTFIYLISVPLLFYATIENFIHIETELAIDLSLYFKLVALFIGLFLYKTFFIQFTSVLFKTPKPSFELLVNILIFNLVIGILILPLITLYFYCQFDIFLYLSLIIYIIVIISRLFRELLVGLSRSIFSILHLFLYLCTLEFIPIVIIGKILINYYMP